MGRAGKSFARFCRGGLLNLRSVNQLFFGDNLNVLREHIKDEPVDLTMMANCLLQLHRVLKPTGSLYLHYDPINVK